MNAALPFRRSLIPLGLVLSLLNVVATAQTEVVAIPAEAIPLTAVPRPVRPAAPPSEVLFNLDFPGGTVTEFVDAISKARGIPFNVVIHQDATNTLVAPVKMHQVDVTSLLTAVSNANIKSVKIAKKSPGGGSYYERGQMGFMFEAVSKGISEVWYLRPIEPPRDVSTLDAVPEPMVKFYNLEPYLAQHTIDDITTVLTAGNELRTGAKEGLDLKFHKETKLLIVRGSREDLAMVEDALQQLRPPGPVTPNLPGTSKVVPTPAFPPGSQVTK